MYIYASCEKKEIKIFLLLRLEFIVFWASGALLKNFTKQNFFFAENISCCTNISGQLCQQTKNFFLLTFRDNGGHQFGAKIHIFRIFWPLDGIGEVWKLETSKLDSPFQKSSSQYFIGSISCVSVAIWISMAVMSWRSESSNISWVVLDKLLFGFQLDWPLGEVNQAM